MDNPSFAEIKEKFRKMNTSPYPKPPTVPANNNESSSLDPSTSERLKNDSSNQSIDNANSTISDPTTSSSQASNETSSSRDAILARIRQQAVNSTPTFKKLPVPLPNPVSQHQNENTSSESSSVSQDTTLPRDIPSDINTLTVPKKPPIPLPTSDQNENTYSELSNDLPDSTLSSNVLQDTTGYMGFTRPSIPLPNPVNTDRREPVHSESLSVSLDAMLPSKCMFLEFETMINDYQRKDPRTIIYPKIKTTMPKLTTNEIDILQRYSNT